MLSSKGAILGIYIIVLAMTLYAVIAIPLESFRQWNNPNYWINYPKSAAPAWTNLGLFGPKESEQTILGTDGAEVTSRFEHGIHIVTHSFAVNFKDHSFPTDFMIPYSVKYGL